jgi:hypothetical protein
MAVAALVGAVTVGLAGCGKPTGVDGNLTDDWQAIAAPQGFQPEAGTCHMRYEETGTRSSYDPVECTVQHLTETAYVGTTDASEVPAPGAAEYETVVKDCETNTAQFLGGDWHDGNLDLAYTFPSDEAWAGGAHWYRCEVIETDAFDGSDKLRPGSLKGELAKADSAVKLRCYSYDGKKDPVAIACAKKHNTEYVGSIPLARQADAEKDATMVKACRVQIAKYVGMAYRSDMNYRVGVFWQYPDADNFAAGDHKVRCYAWFSRKTVTGSLKGKGIKVLPIQYA